MLGFHRALVVLIGTRADHNGVVNSLSATLTTDTAYSIFGYWDNFCPVDTEHLSCQSAAISALVGGSSGEEPPLAFASEDFL